MKIIILNGNPDPANIFFDESLVGLYRVLEDRNHKARILILRDMKIHHCNGCFNCWYKTPGTCIFKDDMRTICREYINSDYVIFASPIIMGFTSFVLKKTIDRLIPLGQPYGNIYKKKLIHMKRYFQYPSIGLVLERESDTCKNDIIIINNLYRDISTMFFSKLMFTKFIDKQIKDIADEINHC